LLDEVYAPLGLAPAPGGRSTDGRPRGKGFAVALAVLAFVSGVVAPSRRDAPHPDAPVAAAKPEAETAKAEAQPAGLPAPSASVAEAPPLPPIASAGQVEAASGVKVTRKGDAAAPAALIIDVQQALAMAKLKAALDARR
jgi:hypothetical protein